MRVPSPLLDGNRRVSGSDARAARGEKGSLGGLHSCAGLWLTTQCPNLGVQPAQPVKPDTLGARPQNAPRRRPGDGKRPKAASVARLATLFLRVSSSEVAVRDGAHRRGRKGARPSRYVLGCVTK